MARLTGWFALVLASQTGIATGEIGECTTTHGRDRSEKSWQDVVVPDLQPFRRSAHNLDALGPCIAFEKYDNDSAVLDRYIGAVGRLLLEARPVD